MGIDAFGHPAKNLPQSDPGKWSEGPERNVGPPCWQNIEPSCAGAGCNDHQGCCDACRHRSNEICGFHCCRCVPMAICAVFRPDGAYAAQDAACRVRSYKMLATANADPPTRSTYSCTVGGNQIVLSVGEPEHGSPLNGYADCTWRLECYDLGIDEEWKITHSKGGVNCLQLPDLLIENVNIPYTVDGVEYSCVGNIEFAAWEMDKVPYSKRHFDETTIVDLYSSCGSCSQTCSILAVYRGSEADYGYSDDDSCVEFTWSDADQKWSNNSTGESILITEVDGSCYLELSNWAEVTFEGDLIAIGDGECTTDLVKTIRDELGNWVKIACKPCSCWEHICGDCRCVPDTLCAIGVVGNELVGPYELAWDSEYLQWSGYDVTVTIGQNYEGTGCALTFGDFEPVDVECGHDMSATFAYSPSLQAAGYTDFFAVWAKACEGSCTGGTCLSECEDVPQILYAHVYPRDWTPGFGCDGYPASDCFEPVVVPLAQIFVSTVLNPAGEWRWVGSYTFSCRGCDTGGNPSFTTYSDTTVRIDIGCDGLGSATFTGPAESGSGTATEIVDIDFVLPCDGSGYWQLGPFTKDSDGSLICCNEAGFRVYISDDAGSYS